VVFHIITIFPKIFDSYFSESIVKRAQNKKMIDIKIHNLRDFTTDKHKTVDDTPYGGGAGMVLKIEPIYDCLLFLSSKLKAQNSKVRKDNLRSRVILFSAKGKRYTQADAKRLAKYDNIVMICGRYEGVDERVAKYLADEEISIGDYVLTGGELPAMIVADSITRLIPGVLGNAESTKDESFTKKNYLEYPQFTKPAEYKKMKVPEVLLGGNHKKIEEWRKKKSKN
jgi:tRNA (guanine37-N1)-methyltransferase